MMKTPNYLTFGRAMSGLNVDEPKLSSILTLRVELKQRNVRFVDMMYAQANSR